MEKLRVLYLIPDLGKGGAERFLVDLCTELKHRGDVDFKIGTLYEKDQYSDYTGDFEMINLHFSNFSFRGKNENPAYKALLESFKPHIVHTHLYLAEFLSAYYVDPAIQYVCHGHDNMPQLANFSLQTLTDKPRLMNFLEKRHLTKHKYKHATTHYIVNSTHTQSYYEKVLPAALKPNIRLIQYGFNFARFDSGAARSIGKHAKIRLLNVGSFQEKKNQQFLVKIAIELRERGIDFEIHMAGHGAAFDRVKNAVIENKLEDQVLMHGIIDNVQDWYKTCDIYLHTAYYEPFGLVFLEAMAAGLPVVTLDGQGNRDLIDHGKNGFIHSEENAKLFADTIQQLVEDPALYKQISAAGRAYARGFDVSVKIGELVDFYNSVAKR